MAHPVLIESRGPFLRIDICAFHEHSSRSKVLSN